jgi:hypothetical protein
MYSELDRHQESQEAITYLLNKCEFVQQGQNGQKVSDFINYYEGTIQFAPTGKYKAQSTEYQGQQLPGWHDRILVQSHDGLIAQQVYYSRLEIT